MYTIIHDSDLKAKLIASQAFAQTYAAFLECSIEIQEGIREMVLILRDPSSTDDECRMAMSTIAEALFPTELDDHMDINLEASFASNVEAIMKERNITQAQLADAAGIGQPAISMMLARACHPQRRTIERIASALNVDPASLWSYKKAKSNSNKNL